MNYKEYFTDEEFACKCGRGDACDAPKKIDPFFRIKLNGVRLELGLPMIATSGIRCKFQNEKVGGEPDSQHLVANATDFESQGGDYMRNLVRIAMKFGLSIGIKKGMVHLDNRPGRPVMFGYVE